MALLENIKKFSLTPNVKVLCALRKDLLESVLNTTRQTGYQPDKADAFHLYLYWTKSSLRELISKRINVVFSDRYKKSKEISLGEIFPKSIENQTIEDYILDRCSMRPRDAITFVNLCIEQFVLQDNMSTAMIKSAEAEFSERCWTNVIVEWGTLYTCLDDFFSLLLKKPPSSKIKSVSSEEIDNLVVVLYTKYDLEKSTTEDPILSKLRSIFDSETERDFNSFRKDVFFVLYQAGVVGLKIAADSKPKWSYEKSGKVLFSDVTDGTSICINKAFYRKLGIVPKKL